MEHALCCSVRMRSAGFVRLFQPSYECAGLQGRAAGCVRTGCRVRSDALERAGCRVVEGCAT
jgi:hypothetical protein